MKNLVLYEKKRKSSIKALSICFLLPIKSDQSRVSCVCKVQVISSICKENLKDLLSLNVKRRADIFSSLNNIPSKTFQDRHLLS